MFLSVAFSFILAPQTSHAREAVSGGRPAATSSRQITQDPNVKLARAAILSINSGQRTCENGNMAIDMPSDETMAKLSEGIWEGEPTQDVPKKSTGECAPRDTKYSQDGERMTLKNGVIDSAPGGTTDCSGFISGLLCRVGARLKPGDDGCGPVNTVEMLEWGTPNDCFEIAEFTAMQQLKPGCLIVWQNSQTRRGHVVMIVKSGANSFGIQDDTNCKQRPQSHNFDFEVAESAFGIGPIRLTGRRRFYGDPRKTDLVALAPLFEKACETTHTGTAQPAQATRGPFTVKMLCHSGQKKPGCLGKERKFSGESCVARCTATP